MRKPEDFVCSELEALLKDAKSKLIIVDLFCKSRDPESPMTEETVKVIAGLVLRFGTAVDKILEYVSPSMECLTCKGSGTLESGLPCLECGGSGILLDDDPVLPAVNHTLADIPGIMSPEEKKREDQAMDDYLNQIPKI